MTERRRTRQDLPLAQRLTERASEAIEQYLHVEAVSGVVLLAAAVTALIWANSPLGGSYQSLWHQPLFLGVGSFTFSRSLHFWINDALMTVFFLVVGMEIRREIHDGSLSDLKQAVLPMAAALGGVVAPALIYLALTNDPSLVRGWAVPTATDIAFAVGILALLGRSVPHNLRIFLLTLAIVDDIIAVLIIALYLSGGLAPMGFMVAGVGVALVLGLQRIGIGSAYAFVPPGAIVWFGLLMTGAHPTLAGVVLGLMTPVVPISLREHPVEMVSQVADELRDSDAVPAKDTERLARPLRELRLARRELLPPAVRVELALHPWVAYGILPTFALANAGISFESVDLDVATVRYAMFGVAIALALGKPVGVIAATWLVVRLGQGQLPPGVSWAGICLIGLLSGIGFTLSIFIARLAFADASLLAGAMLGVLLGSLVAAVLGLCWGLAFARRRNAMQDGEAALD